MVGAVNPEDTDVEELAADPRPANLAQRVVGGTMREPGEAIATEVGQEVGQKLTHTAQRSEHSGGNTAMSESSNSSPVDVDSSERQSEGDKMRRENMQEYFCISISIVGPRSERQVRDITGVPGADPEVDCMQSGGASQCSSYAGPTSLMQLVERVELSQQNLEEAVDDNRDTPVVEEQGNMGTEVVHETGMTAAEAAAFAKIKSFCANILKALAPPLLKEIEEVLRHLGFGVLFLKWVAILLNTANTKVVVNGEPGGRILHARGLRQGEPTSPMLFVIGMEVLTKIMLKAVDEGLFDNLAGISPIQRISVYADDVVLFFRPVETELQAIKQILQIFGEASGLHINYRKTTTTVIRGEALEEERITKALGCETTKFPIKYLGLQLGLRPLTRAEWQPMLDKALHLLPAWQRGMVRKEGRLVLIKSVLSARAIHHLLVEEAPSWLLDEIIKCITTFFWAVKNELRGG
ncbi:hypothetical protein ACQ4PT_000437 [Festuca glaucescens]